MDRKAETRHKRIHINRLLCGLLLALGACASEPEIVSYQSVKARVMNEQGLSNYRKGDLNAALANFQKAREYADATDNQLEATRARISIGEICMETDELELAGEYLKQALQTARELDDETLLFNALATAGKFQFRIDAFEKAEDLFEEAVDVAEDMDSSDRMALALNDLGALYKVMGRQEDALEKLQYALFLYENLEGRVYLEGRASVLNNLAAIREEQGKYEKAWDLLTSSLACYQQLGDSDSLITCHANMAHLLENWGKKSDALLRYERAYGVAKGALKLNWMEISLTNIVRLTRELGLDNLTQNYQDELDKIRLERYGKAEAP